VLKTLIVEDNRFNRETLQELLTEHFPTMMVGEASSGEEAVQKIESLQPDLIVMDIVGSKCQNDTDILLITQKGIDDC